MPSVADLVSPERLDALATASNRRLGAAIRAEGGVVLTAFGPLEVTATVGGTASSPTRRQVALRSVPAGGLEWSCTCSGTGGFCKHAVAAALETWDKAPRRRSR